jgi:hypothetical protein
MARYVASMRESTLTYYDSSGTVVDTVYTVESEIRDTADPGSSQWFPHEAAVLDERRTRDVQRSATKTDIETERGI